MDWCLDNGKRGKKMNHYGITLLIGSFIAFIIAIMKHDYFYLTLFIALYIFAGLTDIQYSTTIHNYNEVKK